MDKAEALKPKTLWKAIKRTDWIIQKVDMAEEYKILIDISTQKLVDLLLGINIVGL